MITHQVLMVLVVDTRILGCVADSLQDRRFASISPTDYKDTKISIFRSEVIGIAHGRCEGKRDCVGAFDTPHTSRQYPLYLG